jgi:adenylyltransferase/sulfurtransferase
MELSIGEKNQYQRHLSLPKIGEKGQISLKEAKVLVVGAGGLGCPVLQYLAAAGVGKIGIVDQDGVEPSNLHRQVLYTHDDIGEAKVNVASQKLKRLNPYIEIVPHLVRLTAVNADSIFDGYDLVVDCTDNFASRYLINDACVLYGKVLIYGAIYQFEGQISVFNFNDGPTYRCLFPEPPQSDILPNCSEIGVLGVLPGIIGSFQAMETIKVITGIGDVLSGKVLLYDALKQNNRVIKIKPNKKNREIVELSDTLYSCSADSQLANSMIIEIEPKQFSEMLVKSENVLVIDVREQWEREVSKISPSCHIPLGEFSSSVEPILPDECSKEQTVMLYCKAGVRSRMACEVLKEHGFKNLFNLSGGILKWEAEGYPLA